MPPKRKKAADVDDDENVSKKAKVQEKRGARFRAKAPQNILDRVDRVRQQRFFMISRRRSQSELKEEFDVLGSTGNVYTVTISHTPSCTCPDALKGNHCKHILFIFIKVLQVPTRDSHWYQKALLTSELEDVFSKAPKAPNSEANTRIKAALDAALGREPTEAGPSSQPNRRMPSEDDDCPICYEGMKDENEASLNFCESCGNAVHKECWTQWQRNCASTGKTITCVYCRAVAPTTSSSSPAKISRDGYINLAGVAGVSEYRDTSTYYNGPRRGQRYGYYY